MNMRGSDGLPCATMDEVQQESLCKLVALGNSVYSVNVGGQTVNAHMSGKLRMNYVRIAPGDRVRVEGSRITYKYN